MKYLPLVLANLGRHKRRTILTITSVALALFLFASLQTVVTTIGDAAKLGACGDRAERDGIRVPAADLLRHRLQATPRYRA